MPRPPDRPRSQTATQTLAGRPMRLRADRPDGAMGRGSVLGAFRLDADAGERRAEPRHQPVECLAWVGWRTGRGFAMNDAVLVNLSRGGARVFLDQAPPRGRDVWIYLATPSHKAIVKARVLAWEITPSGQCAARLAFAEPCPYALFEAAVCGLSTTDPKSRPSRRAAAVRSASARPG